MPDISMCPGHGCHSKEACLRYTAKPSEWQSYTDFTQSIPDGGDRCEWFLQDNPATRVTPEEQL